MLATSTASTFGGDFDLAAETMPRIPDGIAELAPQLRTSALEFGIQAHLIGTLFSGIGRMFAWMYEEPKPAKH